MDNFVVNLAESQASFDFELSESKGMQSSLGGSRQRAGFLNKKIEDSDEFNESNDFNISESNFSLSYKPRELGKVPE